MPRRCSLVWIAAAAAMASAAVRAVEPPPDQSALDSVLVHIERKDCAAAAQALNEGIAKRQRDVLLMAGTMYEEGICLKPNWPRAAQMYQLSYEHGRRAGALRLIAGAAVPGRDPAAAIWWALKADVGLPESCKDVTGLLDAPEAFVARLQAWPSERLDMCLYTAGLAGTLGGDAEFPFRARYLGLRGTYRLRLFPVTETIEWRSVETDTVMFRGVVDGDRLREREESRSARDTLKTYVESIVRRALARYTKPAGLARDLSFQVEYVFQYAS